MLTSTLSTAKFCEQLAQLVMASGNVQRSQEALHSIRQLSEAPWNAQVMDAVLRSVPGCFQVRDGIPVAYDPPSDMKTYDVCMVVTYINHEYRRILNEKHYATPTPVR